MSVLLILFGIVGYTFLGTREYPVTESPTVMVTTVYPGASADIIASQVTKPLEEAIAEANGIRACRRCPASKSVLLRSNLI
jgi:multidrug efflux pump